MDIIQGIGNGIGNGAQAIGNGAQAIGNGVGNLAGGNRQNNQPQQRDTYTPSQELREEGRGTTSYGVGIKENFGPLSVSGTVNPADGSRTIRAGGGTGVGLQGSIGYNIDNNRVSTRLGLGEDFGGGPAETSAQFGIEVNMDPATFARTMASTPSPVNPLAPLTGAVLDHFLPNNPDVRVGPYVSASAADVTAGVSTLYQLPR